MDERRRILKVAGYTKINIANFPAKEMCVKIVSSKLVYSPPADLGDPPLPLQNPHFLILKYFSQRAAISCIDVTTRGIHGSATALKGETWLSDRVLA